MILFSLRTLLLIVAGVALFRLWRAAKPPERWLQWVVAAGFLGRAFLGQALFWISWARLPFARSLQMGDGFWIFAPDATYYFPEAIAAAEKGWGAILFYDRASASMTYVQALAVAVWLFGAAVFLGVLINLFCYLGTMAILARWSRRQPRTRSAAALAIVALSLSPGLVLWSLQPLKDPLFLFLFVAFVATCAAWQRAWLTPNAWAARLGSGALLPLLLAGIAGMRWYFAAALIVATTMFMLLVMFQSAERKSLSLTAAAVVVVLLSVSGMIVAAPQLPGMLTATVTPAKDLGTIKNAPVAILAVMDQARTGFEQTRGGTKIKVGKRLTPAAAPPAPAVLTTAATPPQAAPPKPAARPAPPKPTPPPAPPQFTEVDDAQIRALLAEQAAAWNRNNSGVGNLTISDLRIVGSGDAASVSGRWTLATHDGQVHPHLFTTALQRLPAAGWKITGEVIPAHIEIAPPVQPRRPRMAWLVSGAAALVLPRVVGHSLGLFEIGGGRGLLWFAEIETLLFDLVLAIVVVAFVRARRSAPWRSPLTWLVVLTTLLIAGPIAYSINNFGTLFRLREMIYLGLLLTPLALATACNRDPGSSSPA